MNQETMEALFPEEEELRSQGRCPFCGLLLGEFRDALSRREAEISGLCQACQDEFFTDTQNV